MKKTNLNKFLPWIVFLLIIVLIGLFVVREGLDNPEGATIKCMSKGLKCDYDSACCEGLKCLGKECK